MSKAISTTTMAAPPAAPSLPSPSRRQMFAGSGLVAGLAAIGLSPLSAHASDALIASTSPQDFDATLLDACAAFMAARNAMYAVPDSAPDKEHSAALDGYHEAFEAVESIRPQSLAGLKAKARVIMDGFEMGAAPCLGTTVEEYAEWHEIGVWRLMHDVLAMERAS